MKKVIFNCANNILLFTLFGLAFMFPFSTVRQMTDGVDVSLTAFPIIFIVYLLIYPFLYFFIRKKFHWEKKDNSELVFADEREKEIVSQATTTTYKVLIGGLISAVAIIAVVRFFALFIHRDVSIYKVSVLSITLLLILAMITYCMKWCSEYRK